ncbi:MAG: bifunctional glutamate N-acetyltransferase/amino-acid acetyltransferase ArgJ [Bacteroidota bacterium]
MNKLQHENFPTVDGGITAAQGFQAAGIHCGIKKVKKDLAIIFSEHPATVAAVFTTNRTLAEPLKVDKLQLRRSRFCSAVIVNSGNANACTGSRGLRDAWTTIEEAARVLNIPPKRALVSSTGVIGKLLPIAKVKAGIRTAATHLGRHGHADAAQAILTTDTFTKEYAVKFKAGSKTITVGGMAKGSGMIAPNMATMLAFVSSDVVISASFLQKALTKAVDKSFNRITVDGDTSTNDMVLLLANGLAKNPPMKKDSAIYRRFCAALKQVLAALAKMIARDGEGATKLIEVVVTGAREEEDAIRAARAIANSNLVKTAVHGADANWGRILAAVGYSGISFAPEKVEISFDHLPILKRNFRAQFSEKKARAALSNGNVNITVDLNLGKKSATFWTCDLSREYVSINASYRS